MSTSNRKNSAKPQKGKKEVIEDVKPVVEEPKTITTEQILTSEPVVFDVPVQVIDETSEEKLMTEEEIKENLENFHNVDAEAEMTKLLEASADPQKFAENYVHVNEEKSEIDAEIEKAVEEFKKLPDVPASDLTLPIEVPFIPVIETPAPVQRQKKTFAQMTACEMNIYQKTGIIPFV
jgi:transcription termination factor NusB